ncbi:hypothetical protein JL720_5718 [Aureococcus anophagefferens]|nr:hypothetical protein JL720_5718 [Aureococcus anophagefferens]
MGGSLRELVAGGAGGASMVVVGHPLDTVKATFLRAVPANAACFGGYEACVRAFDTA